MPAEITTARQPEAAECTAQTAHTVNQQVPEVRGANVRQHTNKIQEEAVKFKETTPDTKTNQHDQEAADTENKS